MGHVAFRSPWHHEMWEWRFHWKSCPIDNGVLNPKIDENEGWHRDGTVSFLCANMIAPNTPICDMEE